ncbi:hypothetical protein E5S67_04421 [Microcoleus sp. IPMA8]|uniref:Uncharacterized protein n=1 Tax=Microcoleus asticus IPMA8 TaxID=2563858 RepID=A0ABX2D1X9_9CYAN|nr:hypothetical protein [Microcoleus asticus IPMA8]
MPCPTPRVGHGIAVSLLLGIGIKNWRRNLSQIGGTG